MEFEVYSDIVEGFSSYCINGDTEGECCASRTIYINAGWCNSEAHASADAQAVVVHVTPELILAHIYVGLVEEVGAAADDEGTTTAMFIYSEGNAVGAIDIT